MSFHDGASADKHLRDLRFMYEPYVMAMAHRLMLPISPWIVDEKRKDNWETSAWDKLLREQRQMKEVDEEHF